MINIEKIKPTGLFTNYIYKAIPLAFDESMSYYETLCGLLAYLKNTVIPTLNNNADAIIEVQNLMIDLQDYVDNYFKNLDVQEEINNKLDEMVEDGTLPEIIASYLNSKAIFGFDNVELMKNATNLINGSYAKTLGYHTKNDGGGNLYKIREITNDDLVDDISIIPLQNNSLIAELIVNDIMNIEQFGIKGDNTNETLKLQIAINKMENKKLLISNKEILIDDTINLPTKIIIKSNFGKIKYNKDLIYVFAIENENTNNDVHIEGLRFEKIDNNFNNLNRFIYINGGNLYIKNCKFNNYGTAIQLMNGDILNIENCIFNNVYGTVAQYGYGINTSTKYNYINNIKFINTNSDNGRHCIYLNGTNNINTDINNVYIENWHHNPIQINIHDTSVQPIININNITGKNVLLEADGSNPRRVIGLINIAQDSYGKIYINNIKDYNAKNCIIYSIANNAEINASNLYGEYITSDSEVCCGVYIRYGTNHKVNNIKVNNTNDPNFSNVCYIRNTNAILNELYEIGTNGSYMITGNNANIKLGLYSTDKQNIANSVGETSITGLNLYS